MARSLLPLLAFLICLLAAMPACAASPAKPDYNGSYELGGKRTDRVFSLQVQITGHRAKVTFSASMADGSGAAPDAAGNGKIDDGVLTFKFKDSFDNEGTCKLRPLPGSSLYELDMTVTKVVESSPLHFYGSLQLKKTSPRATP